MTVRVFFLLFLMIFAGGFYSPDLSALGGAPSAQIIVKSSLQSHPGVEVSGHLHQFSAPEKQLLYDLTAGFEIQQGRVLSSWLSRDLLDLSFVFEFGLPPPRAPPV